MQHEYAIKDADPLVVVMQQEYADKDVAPLEAVMQQGHDQKDAVVSADIEARLGLLENILIHAPTMMPVQANSTGLNPFTQYTYSLQPYAGCYDATPSIR